MNQSFETPYPLPRGYPGHNGDIRIVFTILSFPGHWGMCKLSLHWPSGMLGPMCGGFTHSRKYFLTLQPPLVIKYGLICLWFTLAIFSLCDIRLHGISSKLF
jgi:hypothetical protein